MGLMGLASKYLVPGSSISSSSDNKKRNRQQSRRKRKDYAGVRSVRVCRSFRVRECQNAMAASNGPGAFAHQPAHGEKPQPWGLLGLLKQSPASLPIGCPASFSDSSDSLSICRKCVSTLFPDPHLLSAQHKGFLNEREFTEDL